MDFKQTFWDLWLLDTIDDSMNCGFINFPNYHLDVGQWNIGHFLLTQWKTSVDMSLTE